MSALAEDEPANESAGLDRDDDESLVSMHPRAV